MLRTPASERRLDILEWLKDPAAHFPQWRYGDLVSTGVTSEAVAEKLGVPRAVAETHLSLLAAIGVLRATTVRRRTYYRRDEMRIAEVARMFDKGW
ncbi:MULTISPECIES: ArsR family transcriptional regulator [unclassified Streptomyces]|uniref:ArsR family transcriptional regulator n=1 Tax=unclassified Streptomyces TaxID=2593676 RepID=UPI001661E2D1|nr:MULTISPECIES: ArsR family transcriptional regulator [unclassified Streptomyces]MBD0841544.1 ArsR family transcriptional regulator [Streptomyces sp. TRM68416]